MMVGGFLGDSLGGWINDNAPGVAQRFGNAWDSMMGKFSAIGDKFKPVIEAVNTFLQGLGFEDGLGSVFSVIAEYVGTTLMQPFQYLIGIFGFLFDIVGAFGQLLSGDFAGAWQTVKQGFFDLIYTVLGPMVSLFETIYNGFAKLWNGLAESDIGSFLGLGKMQEKDFSGDLAKALNQNEETSVTAATKANQPVVEATKAQTAAQATAAQKTSEVQTKMQNELKFTGDAQNKMVSLLAASTILLEDIARSTGITANNPLTLDGRKVNQTLLAQAQTNYALVRA